MVNIFINRVNKNINLEATCIVNRNKNQMINIFKKNNLKISNIIDNKFQIFGKVESYNKMLSSQLYYCKTGDYNYIAPLKSNRIINGITSINFDSDIKFNSYLQFSPNASPSYFTPLHLATLYNFPTNMDGTGQKIGIIELGGGYIMSDITAYLSYLGITATPNITDISVDGAINSGDPTQNDSGEVALDIEIIIALVPKAAIRVYFGQNSLMGFYNAIYSAINDNCNVISISWGTDETNVSSSTKNLYSALFTTAANKGINILCATGDYGSGNKTMSLNPGFPASVPSCIACGGTTLTTNSNRSSIISETVWNNNNGMATGGGISQYYAKPSYQSSVTSINMRGIPDISANADPYTGYIIYINGGFVVFGGTSAVAPLISGLIAIINQTYNMNIGLINTSVYNDPSVCRDITVGNNDTIGGGGNSYKASVGWDPCSGIGVINGLLLMNLFSSNTITCNFTSSTNNGNGPLLVNFTDTSSGNPTSWLWNFSDGSMSTIKNPSHTFNNSGIYNVTLSCSNDFNSGTITNNITVLPIASFTATPLTGIKPLTVQFTNTSQYTNSNKFLWNFGNGTTSTRVNPSCKYNTSGTFTVTLTVTNMNKVNSISTHTNMITVNSPPVASFTGTPLSGKKPLTVQFTDTSSGNPTSWLWNFRNNTTSTLQNPTKIFTKSGKYNVKLTVTNIYGIKTIIRNNYITVK